MKPFFSDISRICQLSILILVAIYVHECAKNLFLQQDTIGDVDYVARL